MNMKCKYLILSVCGWALFFTGFTIPSSYAQSESSEAGKTITKEVTCWWSFNKESGNSVLDEIQQKKDSVYGSIEYVPGIYGNAIKLDGFRSYIKRDQNNSSKPAGAFTVESWIALASYPWSWSPVIDCSYPKIKDFFFGIDPEGHVGFKIAAGSSWYEATTEKKISLRKWTHVAAVFEPDKKVTLFINGKEATSIDIKGNYVPARYGSLTIGRNNSPQTWNEYQLTTEDAYFFLDGLLDEIKISGKAKTEDEISSEYAVIKDLPVPALSNRQQLPTGPVGSGSFGAFYTKLDYYKEWDDLWRVSDVPDVFVRFDQSPVQLVFWRGTSFVPCWVTENGIWYTNEWLETWGDDVVSCAEPIMDRHCRYSHVRLIENTEARVVVHWRYALSDAFYDFVAISDDGRGEWCDEFHIIYPDQVGVRKMELHYSRPERKHDWVEQIVVLPPGKYPDDVIEREAVSLVNMSGDVQKYSWHDDDLKLEMPEPKGANMSFVHLKSKYRPFFIVSPDPVKTVEGTWDSPFFRTYASKMARGYRQDPAASVYGWWNHWPAAMIPSDGRYCQAADRPSHFCLAWAQPRPHKGENNTYWWTWMYGATQDKPDSLTSLARSWVMPPKLVIHAGSLDSKYDPTQRSYVISSSKKQEIEKLEFSLQANSESPVVNPAFVIKNWGDHQALLKVNGKKVPRGKAFRIGHIRRINQYDLVVWLELESNTMIAISMEHYK